MCVAFGMSDVYEFAFSTDGKLAATHELDKRAIEVFRHALEREIVAHSSESAHYKYVHFALDRRSADEFFLANRDRFLDFGPTVVFNGDSSEEQARRIESKYGDPVVISALRTARQEARSLSFAV